MNQIIKQLKLLFYLIVGVSLLLMAVVEFLLLDIAGGLFADDKQFEFVYQSFMILLTLGGIYVVLRFFKFEGIKKRIQEHQLTAYSRWSLIRMLVLEGIAILNIGGYFLFVNSSFVYLWLIIMLSFSFLYPTRERLINETGIDVK